MCTLLPGPACAKPAVHRIWRVHQLPKTASQVGDTTACSVVSLLRSKILDDPKQTATNEEKTEVPRTIPPKFKNHQSLPDSIYINSTNFPFYLCSAA